MNPKLSRKYDKSSLTSILVNDAIGVGSSFLCFLHCNLSVVFYALRLSSEWQNALQTPWLDFAFLLISFIAVWNSANCTSNRWIVLGFCVGFLILSISVIFHDDLYFLQFGSVVGSVILVIVHIWNMAFCRNCNK